MSMVAGSSVMDPLQCLHDVAGHHTHYLYASLDPSSPTTELDKGYFTATLWVSDLDTDRVLFASFYLPHGALVLGWFLSPVSLHHAWSAPQGIAIGDICSILDTIFIFAL